MGRSARWDRVLGLGLSLGLIAGLIGPGAASARAPRRTVVLADCYENTAFFPIPRDQAKAHLPEGFAPRPGPAGQESMTNFYISSRICGEPGDPQIETVTTYLSVAPPPSLEDEQGNGHFYVLDLGAEGSHLSVLDSLCLGTSLAQASISVTQQRGASPLGFGPEAGATASSITSDSLSAEFVVNAEGSTTPMRDQARWFYGDGTRYFDADYELSIWGIGSSAVAFTEPYLDLQRAASGASVQSLADITLTAPRGCRPGSTR